MLINLLTSSRKLLKQFNTNGIRAVSGVLLANVFNQATSFFIIFIAAKLLSVSDFASFGIAISITMLWGMFLDFGLSITIVKYFNTVEYNNRFEFLQVSYYWKIILCLVNILVSFPLTSLAIFFLPVLNGYENLVYIAFLSGGLLSLWQTVRSIEQAQKSYTNFKKFTFIYGFLRLMFILSFLILGKFEVSLAFLSLFALPLSVLLLLGGIKSSILFSFFREFYKVNWKEFFSVGSSYSIWVALSTFCFILLLRLPQFTLGAYTSEKEVALYSSAMTFVVVFSLLNDAIRIVIMPDISSIKTNELRKKYKVKLVKFFPIVLILGVIIMAIVSIIIFYFLDDVYKESIPLFWIIGIAHILMIYIGLFNILIHSYGIPKIDAINNSMRLFLLTVLLILIPKTAVSVSLAFAIVAVLGEMYLFFRIKQLERKA